MKLRGGVYPSPWIFTKAFGLDQDIYEHRQVGQAGESGDAPKEASISDNSVLNPFISNGPRKLNYIVDWEKGGYFFILNKYSFFTYSLLMVYFYF